MRKNIAWNVACCILLLASATPSAAARWDVQALEPVLAGGQAAIPVEIYYVYRKGEQGAIIPMTNGSLLRDGDMYGIVFRPHQRCFIYIFQVDAAKNVMQLFPQTGQRKGMLAHRNPVEKGATYYLPAEDMPLTLSPSSSMRQIYFLASREQDRGLEEAYQDYLLKQADKNPFKGEISRAQFITFIQHLSLSSIAPIVNLDQSATISLDSPATDKEIRRLFSMKLPKQIAPQEVMAHLPAKGVKGAAINNSLDGMPAVYFFNLFQEHSAAIFRESYPALYEYGKALQASSPESVVVIAAHADENGGEQESLELSQRRADAVKYFFMTHFQIEAHRFIVNAYGDHQPLVSPAHPDAAKLNNRIELIRIR